MNEAIGVFGRADYRDFERSNGNKRAADACRKYGVSDATSYKWRSKYDGLDVSEAKRLKGLEEKNANLKRLLADAMMDLSLLKDMLGEMYGLPRRCKVVVSDVLACVNVSGLRSVSHFWRLGLDEIRTPGSRLLAPGLCPVFLRVAYP